jgi:hypothetical protein
MLFVPFIRSHDEEGYHLVRLCDVLLVRVPRWADDRKADHDTDVQCFGGALEDGVSPGHYSWQQTNQTNIRLIFDLIWSFLAVRSYLICLIWSLFAVFRNI